MPKNVLGLQAFNANELFSESSRRLARRKKFLRGGVPLSQSEQAGLEEARIRAAARIESERIARAQKAIMEKMRLDETKRSNLANEAISQRQLRQQEELNMFNMREARKARKATESSIISTIFGK